MTLAYNLPFHVPLDPYEQYYLHGILQHCLFLKSTL